MTIAPGVGHGGCVSWYEMLPMSAQPETRETSAMVWQVCRDYRAKRTKDLSKTIRGMAPPQPEFCGPSRAEACTPHPL